MLSLHFKRFGKQSKPSTFKAGTAVTIGGFDGIHRGHQVLLGRLKQVAQQRQCLSTVLLFYPLPQEFFAPATTSRIYPFAMQIRLLAELGIDQLVCLRFDKEMSNLSAKTFVDFLNQEIKPCYLLIGDDFRFGYQRRGDQAILKEAGGQQGFEVEQMQTVADEGERISSTRIRAAIRSGELAHAEQCLGRDYAIDGRIGHGDKTGRKLGFPTANFISGRWPLALEGVYTAEILDPNRQCFVAAKKCLIHSGHRPTFSAHQYRIEVHIPGFEGDLYGHRLRLYPHKKLRDVKRFNTPDELKAMIRCDVQMAQKEWIQNEQA